MGPASPAWAGRRTRSVASGNAPDGRDEVLGVHAEELVDVGRRRRLAEAVDADDLALEAYVLAPEVRHARLDRHALHALGQHGIAPRGVLAVVDVGAGHGDHAH